MKTTNNLSALGLALIFVGITAGFSKKVADINTSQVFRGPTITYLVNVHVSADIPLCNSYLVQITDETGRLVAPAQPFVLGKNLYTFYSVSKERGYRERGTKRIAMLVTNTKFGALECDNKLYAQADVKSGLFVVGQTYTFNLFPFVDLSADRN
jgi:hypothetical protein